MKSKDEYVLWPIYFDLSKTRKEGRKVSKALAIENPSLQKIYEVATKLNLNPVEERDSRYPRFWWDKSGKILVDKKDRKYNLILDIARELKRPNEKSESPKK
jgi:signal recognition particle subunit SRP19